MASSQKSIESSVQEPNIGDDSEAVLEPTAGVAWMAAFLMQKHEPTGSRNTPLSALTLLGAAPVGPPRPTADAKLSQR